MDLVNRCKDKLAFFRIRELKDVLTELGLSKQGKKQDLVDRILAVLSDDRVPGMWAKASAVGKEEVAKLVEDTYRKMQVSGSGDLASKSQAVADSTKIKPKEDIGDSYKIDKIRCVCGNSLATDSMIKCEDARCNVWQHMKCVLIPEKPREGATLNPPETFYCEICRLSRADPFWVSIAHPLYPVKLSTTTFSTDGSNPGVSVEKTFQLTRADKDLLAKPEYDLQAWCMLLNDKQIFRMHWPQYADLQVNGVPVRAINRPGSQMLGANGRDDGPIVTSCTRDGVNKISVSGSDARIFCVGVRIVKRRTLHQVLNMIPKEADGEPFEDALARVRRCVGGGADTENADSDSDIEVVADCIPVNLRCPMSGSRMKVAGRFKPCAHMGCFDLEVFVEMNQRSRKWQCPICLKNYSLEKIIIDPYFNRITSKLRNCGEDVSEIEVKPDGSWRGKSEGDRRGLGELGLWHFPDGTICPDAESKPKLEIRSVKQEGGSDSNGYLKLGIKKNPNGGWEFNRSISPANRQEPNFKRDGQNIDPTSSSATGSGRDFGDVSVDQDNGGNLDYSAIHCTDYESMPLSIDLTNRFNDQTMSIPAGDNEIIVLSDSDEEIEPQMSSGMVYRNAGLDACGVLPSETQNGAANTYYEANPFVNGGSSSLHAPNDYFGIDMWSVPSTSQGGPLQLFGPDADAPLNCTSSMNGYTPAADTALGSTDLASASCAEDSNVNSGLLDNSLPFSGNDPSLKIFLPTRPTDASAAESDLRAQPDVSNGTSAEDWISLRLGDGGRAGQGGPVTSNGMNPRQHIQPKDNALDSLADTASLLLGMNGNRNSGRTGKTSRESSDSPFTFPRQRRSVRPRLYLSIDTESE